MEKTTLILQKSIKIDFSDNEVLFPSLKSIFSSLKSIFPSIKSDKARAFPQISSGNPFDTRMNNTGIERLTISRHVTLCYQLSTLVCLVLFCCCLLHRDQIHLSPVCETMRGKVFYTKQRKHNYLFDTYKAQSRPRVRHTMIIREHIKSLMLTETVYRRTLESDPHTCNGPYVEIRY